MERDKLSFSQGMALFWGALAGPAAQLLPGEAARAGGLGALAVLGSGGLLLLSGWCMGRLILQQGDLAQGLMAGLGPVFGKGALTIYIVWGQLLLTLRLRLAAQRLLSGGPRDGAVWFYLVVLAGMALWMARGSLGAFGRTAQVMLGVLCLVGGVVLLLALFRLRGENLLAHWQPGIRDGLRLLGPGVGVLSCGLFIPFLLRGEEVKGRGVAWLKWTAGGCLGLTAAQFIIVGNFGSALTGRLESPFFQLAKSVGVEGAFQRAESVVAAVWSFGDLLLLAGILLAQERLVRRLRPAIPAKSAAAAAVLLACVLGVALPAQQISPTGLEQAVLPVGGLFLGLLLPALAVWMEKRRGGWK